MSNNKRKPYKKKRPHIPKAVADAVMKEYSHLCAVCAAIKPQLHHLDENRENNDPLNLLPLCPNCHLTDQHNPTSRRPYELLRLFRKFKDPFILVPQFQPVFQRIYSLYSGLGSCPRSAIFSYVEDLVGFIKELEMGNYYAQQIRTFLMPPSGVSPAFSQKDPASLMNYQRWADEQDRAYGMLVESMREDVERLVVEILRFQRWEKLN